jgi:hypothetical protein
MRPRQAIGMRRARIIMAMSIGCWRMWPQMLLGRGPHQP